jgi:hypothetical protein
MLNLVSLAVVILRLKESPVIVFNWKERFLLKSLLAPKKFLLRQSTPICLVTALSSP